MGTRSVIFVKHDGKFKLSQYGQWDGYPEGQGKTILEYLYTMNEDVFLRNLDKCKKITPEQQRQLYIDAGDSPDNTSGFINFDIADKFKTNNPSLSRDISGKILELIEKSNDGCYLNMNLGSLAWCEWAYLIDFDERIFEVYEVCNVNDKMNAAKFVEALGGAETKFHSYSLDDLPDYDQFIADFTDEDEDEDIENDFETFIDSVKELSDDKELSEDEDEDEEDVKIESN